MNKPRSKAISAGKPKETSSNQQYITSFFSKASQGQLFSTFGSSNKNNKKGLNLSTKKKPSNSKLLQDGKKVVEASNDRSAKISNLKQPQSESADLNHELKLCKEPVMKNNSSSNKDEEDSDDDLIPPTPSPAACQRSFIRSASLSNHNICSESKATTKLHKSHSFTNLKLKRAIAKREEIETRIKNSQSSQNNSSKSQCCNVVEGHSSKSTGPKGNDINSNNTVDSLSHVKTLKMSNCSSSLAPEHSPSPASTTNSHQDDSNVRLLAPQKIVMAKSKAKSLKRSGSKGSSPSNKRHHGDTPHIVAKSSNKEEKLCSECYFDDDDQSMAALYGATIPWTPEKVKNNQINLENNTKEKKPQLEKILTETTNVGKVANKGASTTPITPQKTPIKEYDRQLITDMSLLTPTKNSPNTSRDSLLGVDLDMLMDGVEWSPVPKKTLPRGKLFEDYSPHTSPYSRFLVLEVYRREASHQDAMSKYGRVLSEKVLRLFDESRSVERYCYLRQDWEMAEVEPGDLVHVTGEFDVTSGVCILDNQTDHYIVVHPDTLVSGTTVAGATRCLRRSILNERFRTEDTNEAMLMGTLLHDLFDKAMQSKEFSPESLTTQAKSLLQDHTYLNSLYSLGMTEVTALEKISSSIPVFSDWAKRYVLPFPHPDLSVMDYKTASIPDTKEQPIVCIAELKDIEENIWSPRFGLKGKVDATVEVKIDRRPKIRRYRPDKNNNVETSVVPLELKTGKLFSKLGSIDHRAQVILYTLLLSDRHRHLVDAGLLYYMKAAHMIGVPALVHEKRALIMRRNEVARYLSLSRTTAGRQMPGMLKDVHVCSRCSQVQNCTLFHKSVENGDHVTSGLGEVFDNHTQHLSPDYSRFFADWFKLVCLEGKQVQQSGKTSQHHIWSMKGLDREALGQCFSGLVLTSRDLQMDSNKLYMHRFERSADHLTQTPLVDIPLSTGDRVVVSEEENHIVAIATGYIRDVKAQEVKVALDRDLMKCYRSPAAASQTPVYRLDKDEGYNSLTTPWSNIARLLHKDTTRSDELRRVIIDLKAPVFARSRQALINFGSQSSVGSNSQISSQESKISQTADTSKYRDTLTESLMESLNTDQKKAIKKVLCAEDYTLILGMPGTGKTTTIACLVQILVAMGRSVLLTSYTHTAVDNILLKLKQANLDFLRLGQVHKLLPEIQPYSTQVAGAHVKTVNELRDFYMSKNIVATTCLGVNHALFSQRSYDYCIVDEASQITMPVCLGPLRHASVFVLVGDHYQLPPLVQSLEAREGGMDVSLFKRLSEHHPQAVVCLEHQYRMNEDIMALSNYLIYENRLKCGTQQVATSRLCIPRWDELVSWFSSRSSGPMTDENWLLRALDPSRPVIFLNTDKIPGYESRKERLVCNETEAILVHQLTCALDMGGVMLSSVGIISPYRHQLKVIRETLGQDPRASRDALEINTVDKYQGRDKDCILVSLVRSNETSSVGDLLKDWRRVNVAVTRAKSKLILIGSLSTLKASLLLNELLDLMEKKKWVCDLPQNAHKMYVDLVKSSQDSLVQ